MTDFETNSTFSENQKEMLGVRIDARSQTEEGKQHHHMRNHVAEAQKQISSQETVGVTSQQDELS